MKLKTAKRLGFRFPTENNFQFFFRQCWKKNKSIYICSALIKATIWPIRLVVRTPGFHPEKEFDSPKGCQINPLK